MSEWADKICEDEFKGLVFATTVTKKCELYWVISMILLCVTLSMDCYNHLLYIKKAPLSWKLIVILQVIISMSICFLNALLCAAQASQLQV